jgi:8-oxo-dGTP pyrophosphatase MutT (NUDIX family)
MSPSSPVYPQIDPQIDLATRLREQLNDNFDLTFRHMGRMRFSPSLSYGRHFGPPAPTAKQAAVLIMLEPSEGGWTIPLTERPKHLPDHPGQISLPGGRVEEGENHWEAACREFVEELGTSHFPGKFLGELQSIYVYNSDYFVRPFLAVCDQRLTYAPCEREVERVIRLPVEHLLDDRRLTRQEFQRGKASWHSSTIHCDDALIWGATAIILGEFARIYQRCVLSHAEPSDQAGVC